MDNNKTRLVLLAPAELAIEVKVSAVRKQQRIQEWLMDAARLKLKQDAEAALAA